MVQTTTKIQIIEKTKQVKLTMPKQIAGMLRLNNGDSVEWLLINGEIVLRKV